MSVDPLVQSRVVAFTNDDGRSDAEFSEGGWHELERTEVCAHEDGAAPARQGVNEASTRRVRHLDPVEGSGASATEQERDCQILPGALEASARDDGRILGRKSLHGVFNCDPSRVAEEHSSEASQATSHREEDALGKAIR